MEIKKYIVVVNGYYVRDAQIFNPETAERLTEDEMCDLYEKDQNWKGVQHKDIYLGVYDWDATDRAGLLEYVAKKQGYNAQTLEAYQF